MCLIQGILSACEKFGIWTGSNVTFHNHFILRAKGAKRPTHSQNNKPKSIEKNIFHTRITHDHSVRHGEKLKYSSAPMDIRNMYSVIYKLLTKIAGYSPISILSFWLCYGSRPSRGHLRTQKRDQYSLNKFDQYKIFIIGQGKFFFLRSLSGKSCKRARQDHLSRLGCSSSEHRFRIVSTLAEPNHMIKLRVY